ncbi:nucleotidyl transferase AbiEii/AbiGii toxin family protein [Candidatus Pacearchaeota archaeon]|nr:nucleotidyl transferase AbiEii/AbiGii toxin family protein [Candidatus Pacearchaeota archaeon]
MAYIPINLRLKKKTEKEIAYAQDVIVGEIYKFFPDAIIHGGTAIWRCYQGNRFSEDVDIYINKDENKIESLFKSLEGKGFNILKKRVKESSLYSEFMFNNVKVRLEATFQNKKPYLKKYETSESIFINVYTLSPEDLLIEKIQAYLKRRKIRDLYDVYFLIGHVEKKGLIANHLKKLIENFKKPADEENLANIIIVGAVPNSEEILTEIKKWVK